MLVLIRDLRFTGIPIPMRKIPAMPTLTFWTHWLLVVSILLAVQVTWFLLDSVYSISVGAWFNVLIVNIPCLMLVGIPLVFTAPVFYGQVSSDSESADTSKSIDQAS